MVTNDKPLRLEIARSALDLEALDGDAFALRLWDASPADVSDVVHTLIAKRHRRSVSATEMAAQLAVPFPAMSDAWVARRVQDAGQA